jgi:hypothetical protein
VSGGLYWIGSAGSGGVPRKERMNSPLEKRKIRLRGL